MAMTRDTRRVLALFGAWKLLLLAVVLAGPGPDAGGSWGRWFSGRDGGYDTSTRLHLGPAGGGASSLGSARSAVPPRSSAAPASARAASTAGGALGTLLARAKDAGREAGERLVVRLTRWDAVYFSQTAAHGQEREQEWAFGWGY